MPFVDASKIPEVLMRTGIHGRFLAHRDLGATGLSLLMNRAAPGAAVPLHFHQVEETVVMFAGRAHQIGSPQDIYFRPTTREVADFIGQSNLFAGRVIAREEGRFVVETTIGRMRCEAQSGTAVGSRGHVMVRPEAIRLVPHADGRMGRITQRNFLGNVIDYRVTLPNGTVVSAQGIGGEAREADEEVGLLIDESKAWLLP